MKKTYMDRKKMSSDKLIARDGQSLYAHSHNVAERASEFVRALGRGTMRITYALGLLHDIGKGNKIWQNYAMNGYNKAYLRKYQHTVPGARIVHEDLPGTIVREALEYAILGHHTGLPDYRSENTNDRSTVKQRINQNKYKLYVNEVRCSCSDLIAEIKENEEVWSVLQKAPVNITDKTSHMWVRLITSALVDADYLDAELHEDPAKAAKRGGYLSMPELMDKYNKWCGKEIEYFDTERCIQRNEIREACIRAALDDPMEMRKGVYQLCAPTGSGKTLSSLAFALNHAVKYNKQRIIYVVPFISIIEQTAEKFRAIFGKDNVIEHHSKYDVTVLDDDDKMIRYEHAIENWDAPIIITTANQFYETCVASRTGKIRKLHNVIDSVVVMDEVQEIPKHAVNTAMGSIKCLSSLAGTTFFLMTATMPNYDDYGSVSRQFGVECLDAVDVIEPEKAKQYFAVNPPVHYEWIRDTDNYTTIASEIISEDTDVLAITNTKLICRTLYDEVAALVPEHERKYVYHLSNSMCGAHLSSLLDEIRKKIKENRVKCLNGENPIPIRVISTSLVEAGVDLDFPVVYREIAGLGSIIQAAGRCNREGFYTCGKVRIFSSLYRYDDGGIRTYPQHTQEGLSAFTEVMRDYDALELDTLVRSPEFIRSYYGNLLRDMPQDLLYPALIHTEQGIRFRYVGERFRLIEKETYGVLVHYKTVVEDLIAQLQAHTGDQRVLLRKLSRYIVPIYQGDKDRLEGEGALIPISGYENLLDQQPALLDYDDKTGLDIYRATPVLLV